MFAFSSVDRVSLLGRILQRLNLRFPSLFVMFALLTLADIIVPDVIPLADEIGLALLTLLLGLWKERRTPEPRSSHARRDALARIPHDSSSGNRAVALRDGHAEL